MSLNIDNPVPSHDDNVENIKRMLDEWVLSNPDKVDRDSLLPDDVDPNTLSAVALRDALQPGVWELSGNIIEDAGGSVESAYEKVYGLTPEEISWIVNMAHSIMCFSSHLQEMTEERVQAIALSHAPSNHPIHKMMGNPAGNLPPGIAEMLNDLLGGNPGAPGPDIQVLDLNAMLGNPSGDTPQDVPDLDLDDLFRDLPMADPDSIPPDERQ